MKVPWYTLTFAPRARGAMDREAALRFLQDPLPAARPMCDNQGFSERVPALLCRPSQSFPPSHHWVISPVPDGMPSLPAIQGHVLITALRVAEIDPSCSPFALTSPPPTGCDQSHTIQILASKWRQCRMGGHSLFDGKGASNPYLGLRHPLHPAHSQKPPPSIHRGCPGRAQHKIELVTGQQRSQARNSSLVLWLVVGILLGWRWAAHWPAAERVDEMGGGGSKTNNAAMNGPIVGMRGKAGEPFNLSDAAVTVVRDWDKEFQNALDLIENDEKAIGWVLSSLKIVAWPQESHHAPDFGIHSAWISLKHGWMVGPQNLSSSVLPVC